MSINYGADSLLLEKKLELKHSFMEYIFFTKRSEVFRFDLIRTIITYFMKA